MQLLQLSQFHNYKQFSVWCAKLIGNWTKENDAAKLTGKLQLKTKFGQAIIPVNCLIGVSKRLHFCSWKKMNKNVHVQFCSIKIQ